MEKVKAVAHSFGHILEGYVDTANGVTTFIEVSNWDHLYQPVNPPIENELKV